MSTTQTHNGVVGEENFHHDPSQPFLTQPDENGEPSDQATETTSKNTKSEPKEPEYAIPVRPPKRPERRPDFKFQAEVGTTSSSATDRLTEDYSPTTDGYAVPSVDKRLARNGPRQISEGSARSKNNEDIEDDDCVPGLVYKPTTLEGKRTGTFLESIQDLYANSHRCTDFFRNLVQFLANFLTPFQWIIIFAVLAIIPFTMLVIGSVYMTRCPIDQHIPIFCVIGGLIGLIKIGLVIYGEFLISRRKLARPTENDVVENTLGKILFAGFGRVLTIFLLIWFVAGCFWIYGNHTKVSYEPSNATNQAMQDTAKNITGRTPSSHPSGSVVITQTYCHQTLYQFAFWLITIILILSILLATAVGTLFALLILRKSKVQLRPRASLRSSLH